MSQEMVQEKGQAIAAEEVKVLWGNDVYSALGREFPIEFLEDLASRANLVALEWARLNGCPEEFCTLLGSIYVLQEKAMLARVEKPNDLDASWIGGLVPEVIRDIYALGGNFYDEAPDLKPGMPEGWRSQGI